jgi:sec-independent protein translocase protein TatB
MFDIGWTEMMVIAVVLIVVVGPKDLPKMLRTFGKSTAKLRSMAGDFQKQFNDALKEAELDDVKKSVETLKGLNPANEIKKQLNPFEKAAADVRAGLDTLKPNPPAPASTTAVAAEPLKSGPAAMPGETDAPAAANPQAASPSSAASDEKQPAKPRATRKQAKAASSAKPKATRAKKKTESSTP